MTCQHRIDVAAYLLDALEPAESEQMREHLATCPDCRPEYDDLSGLPLLLSTLTPADIEDIVAPAELPDHLCDQLIARAAVRRRKDTRHRFMVISVAAFGVVIVAVGAVTGLTTAWQAPGPASVTVSATDPVSHVKASATLIPLDWGTQIRLELSGVPWGEQCMLVVRSVDGHQDTAATWVVGYQGSLNITGTTGISPDRIRDMEIVTTSGRHLVDLPPTH